MLTNCTAYAKIVTVKRTNTQRVLVTFDNTRKDKHNCIIVNSHNAVYTVSYTHLTLPTILRV